MRRMEERQGVNEACGVERMAERGGGEGKGVGTREGEGEVRVAPSAEGSERMLLHEAGAVGDCVGGHMGYGRSCSRRGIAGCLSVGAAVEVGEGTRDHVVCGCVEGCVGILLPHLHALVSSNVEEVVRVGAALRR